MEERYDIGEAPISIDWDDDDYYKVLTPTVTNELDSSASIPYDGPMLSYARSTYTPPRPPNGGVKRPREHESGPNAIVIALSDDDDDRDLDYDSPPRKRQRRETVKAKEDAETKKEEVAAAATRRVPSLEPITTTTTTTTADPLITAIIHVCKTTKTLAAIEVNTPFFVYLRITDWLNFRENMEKHLAPVKNASGQKMSIIRRLEERFECMKSEEAGDDVHSSFRILLKPILPSEEAKLHCENPWVTFSREREARQ
jgi:hypothetical protein